MAVRTKLRALRQSRGISQSFLAKQLGFKSVAGYNALELGHRHTLKPEKMMMLAQLLFVEPATIMDVLQMEDEHETAAETRPL